MSYNAAMIKLYIFLQGNTIVSVFTFTSQLSDDGDRFDCVLRHPRLPADLRVSDTVSGSLALPDIYFYLNLCCALLCNFRYLAIMVANQIIFETIIVCYRCDCAWRLFSSRQVVVVTRIVSFAEGRVIRLLVNAI